MISKWFQDDFKILKDKNKTEPLHLFSADWLNASLGVFKTWKSITVVIVNDGRDMPLVPCSSSLFAVIFIAFETDCPVETIWKIIKKAIKYISNINTP